MLPHDAYALSRESIAQIVILVVEVVIGLEPESALVIQQILDVKVSDEVGVTRAVGIVAVAEVAVEQQPVVE